MMSQTVDLAFIHIYRSMLYKTGLRLREALSQITSNFYII